MNWLIEEIFFWVWPRWKRRQTAERLEQIRSWMELDITIAKQREHKRKHYAR
jgi:hypothetical protein